MMKTMSKLCLTLAAAAALAGCQTMRGGDGTQSAGGPNPDCPGRASGRIPTSVCLQNGAACGIAVEVVTGANGACEVAVNTDILQMRRSPQSPQGETTIFWWLASGPTWEFRLDPTPFNAPVIFKGPNAPTAGSQFKPAVLAVDGRVVYVQNLNQDSKKYEYKIRVYKKGSTGPGLESPDPAIINDF